MIAKVWSVPSDDPRRAAMPKRRVAEERRAAGLPHDASRLEPPPLRGRVGAKDGILFRRVACPEAPAHLRDLLLTPRELRGAEEGDEVELAYAATASRGEWYVARNLTKEAR
jgi:hypothetical protein